MQAPPVSEVYVFHDRFELVRVFFQYKGHLPAGIGPGDFEVKGYARDKGDVFSGAELLHAAERVVRPVERYAEGKGELPGHAHGELQVVQPERGRFGYEQQVVASPGGFDYRAGRPRRAVEYPYVGNLVVFFQLLDKGRGHGLTDIEHAPRVEDVVPLAGLNDADRPGNFMQGLFGADDETSAA